LQAFGEEMMRRVLPASLIAILLVAAFLIWDYRGVNARDRRVPAAVVRCGGRMGSLSFWPFGTEYRISLTRPLAEKELKSLVELNALRGSVAVAFVDCELTQQELEIVTRHSDQCPRPARTLGALGNLGGLRRAQIFPTIRRLETVTHFVGGLPHASEQKED
jgi:hypothetical protein